MKTAVQELIERVQKCKDVLPKESSKWIPLVREEIDPNHDHIAFGFKIYNCWCLRATNIHFTEALERATATYSKSKKSNVA